MIRRRLVLGGAAAILGLGLGWAHSTRPRRPRFPDVTLVTHDGRTVRLYEDLVRGDRIVAITFMYAKCNGVCPGITENLLEVQRALGDRMGRDVFFCSITLAPEHDTPEVLREYARSREVGPGWTFLTGDPESVEAARRGLGFVDPDPLVDADRSQHAGVILFGNDALRSWSACPGRSNPSEIVKRLLWMESPALRRAAEERRGP